MLVALWLYATLEGVGSARELARLVERDLACLWLAGGVPVNHHGLSDFRVAHGVELDRLLTESVTSLVAEGLVSLDEVALDGTKVRAHASGGSFRTDARLIRIEADVERRVSALKAEVEHDSAALSRRQVGARERAAREVLARAGTARAALDRLRAEKARREITHPQEEAGKNEPEASLTDPEARRMRFADGAVRAAYNVQVAAVVTTGVIVAIEPTDRRNDKALAVPMVEEIARRDGRSPERLLVDTGYATRDDIVILAEHDPHPVVVYAPPPPERDTVKPDSASNRAYKRSREPEPVKQWRARMVTEDGREVFKRRLGIERLHAQTKRRGLGMVQVCGRRKAQAVMLWQALAHNLLAAHRLRTVLC